VWKTWQIFLNLKLLILGKKVYKSNPSSIYSSFNLKENPIQTRRNRRKTEFTDICGPKWDTRGWKIFAQFSRPWQEQMEIAWDGYWNGLLYGTRNDAVKETNIKLYSSIGQNWSTFCTDTSTIWATENIYFKTIHDGYCVFQWTESSG